MERATLSFLSKEILSCFQEEESQESGSDGKTREERFLELRNAISVNSKHLTQLKSASVLLVDDVMTSGATFSAATEACLHACADACNCDVSWL